MTDVWLSSDFHFGHEGILKFVGHDGLPMRVFDNAAQMDEYMITQHNSVVKPGDKFYSLGDIAMKPDNIKTVGRCNGSKTLILGNHDSPEMNFYKGFFKHVYSVRRLGKFMLSHIPLHELSLGGQSACIHGHVHNNIVPGFFGPKYYNISIEVLDDYKPINLDELTARVEKQLNL